MDRFFAKKSDSEKYYIDLTKEHLASEMAAISLIKDAFMHSKELNYFWEERNGRRWLKAVNIHN